MTWMRGVWSRTKNDFQGRSIKSKLTLIIVVASSVAMLLTASGFVAYELLTFRSALASEMSSNAEILGAASRAPLSFRDRHAAIENLSALRGDRRIVQAYLVDRDNKVVSHYGSGVPRPLPVFPGAQSQGEYFTLSSLVVFRPIILDGETLGTICLEVRLDELYARIWRYLAIVCLVLGVSLLFALLLAVPLQRAISQPIQELAQIARRFSSGVNPGERAIKRPGKVHDEIGLLIDSFNDMLAKVEASSDALILHRDVLEKTVSSRTSELTSVNCELKEELAARQIA